MSSGIFSAATVQRLQHFLPSPLIRKGTPWIVSIKYIRPGYIALYFDGADSVLNVFTDTVGILRKSNDILYSGHPAMSRRSVRVVLSFQDKGKTHVKSALAAIVLSVRKWKWAWYVAAKSRRNRVGPAMQFFLTRFFAFLPRTLVGLHNIRHSGCLRGYPNVTATMQYRNSISWEVLEKRGERG